MVRSLLIAMAIFAPQNLFATSFDCRAATHISDKVICHYEDLSSREEAYVIAYQTSISRGGLIAAKAKKIAARQMVDRRNCEGEPYCIRDVLEAARTALEAGNDTYWDGSGSDYMTTAEAGSWKQLDPLSVDDLVSLWFRMNDSCRGGNTQMHIDDCTTREEVSEYLTRMRGWCYGRDGEPGVDAKWHECGPGSAGVP